MLTLHILITYFIYVTLHYQCTRTFTHNFTTKGSIYIYIYILHHNNNNNNNNNNNY